MTEMVQKKGLVRLILIATGFVVVTLVLVIFKPGAPDRSADLPALPEAVTRAAAPEPVAETSRDVIAAAVRQSQSAPVATPAPRRVAPAPIPASGGSLRDMTFSAIHGLKTATGDTAAPGQPGSLLHSVVQRSLRSDGLPVRRDVTNIQPVVAPAQPTPQPAPAANTYLVQPGDTLVSIARDVYGDVNMATVLFVTNQSVLARPDSLSAGMTLRLPAN